MENRLQDSFPDRVYRAVAQQSPDWLWIFDDAGTPIGISPKQWAGQSLYRLVHDENLEALKQACRVLLRERQPFLLMLQAVMPDGARLWLEVRGFPVHVEEGHVAAAVSARDITPYKQQEERLTRLAYYDALTGLPNRRLFQDRFMQAMHIAKRYHHKLGILYIDLDDFKRINDKYGHSVGDELLTAAASRLSHSIRDPDTVCRMGGDEFVVLVQQVDQTDDMIKIGRRISEALRQPFDIGGHHIRISSSIGAALYPQDGYDGETLLQCADNAMYASKQLGKNQFRFFTDPEA
ncbi:PAS domain S-box-containing protein/diguanylate cyclase (GGDEF) domain-containing protein [Paenibacillus sp. UNCCL117]|uniref:sensor domain-containing protein n=1 Tax=unclassified Paenibacillus TaxID=185978 RepID=UPI00087EDC8F|nr:MULTISPECIES: sensor domain-containing diguanylate cyclase [unclassified Paenibacillus]SDD26169.1 PAS domain S-box-containing protein/diguanylate cyclase (GGDEF) domain-containing protein [Paenibacillus sp. cl123]SFW41137.1 PAS domain S-box-containing protein/diguanylate cyclase (GGDEF) domain-containing protein [Paenibacillus sp. UNCCL117]